MSLAHVRRDRIKALAIKTCDAYSYDAYGADEWRKAIGHLIGLDYDNEQIEAIMRSKWTRWARDEHSSYEGRGVWIKQFVLAHAGRPGYSVDELVAGTF